MSTFRLNPNPIRAAVQIGCDGLISGATARIDLRRAAVGAASAAIRDAMSFIELPLASAPRLRQVSAAYDYSSAGILDDSTIADATNKLRQVAGAVVKQSGVSESALLLMPPFDRAENTRIVAEMWSREFRAPCHLFGELDFRRELQLRLFSGDGGESVSSAPSSSSSSSSLTVRSASADENSRSEAGNLEACWFLAHTAAAKNLAPQRLLVLSETSESDDVELVGCELDNNSSSSASTEGQIGAPHILRWVLPLTATVCHRMLYEDVQRRPPSVYQGARHSVNPIHRSEVAHLNSLIAQKLSESPPPEWVMNRVAAGGVVCGSSPNGFALNTAARVAGAVNVALEKLEQTTEFQYAGLSDALLANFPLPSLVVPQSCLVAQLCRAMRCRRIQYLAEVGVPHALLVHSGIWAEHHQQSAEGISPAYPQTFSYPHQAVDKGDPNRVRW